MQLNPYLNFNGQCEAAFKFYEQCLGGKIEAMIPFGETPMLDNVPAGWAKKIAHAHLIMGDRALMGCDTPPECFEESKGFAVMLGIEDPAAAERIFKALAKNGKVRMPMEETFWALRFGMLVDQFGIPWMINCEKAGAEHWDKAPSSLARAG